MENKNKEKVLTIIGVMTLLLFGVGATFAYFVAQGGNAEQTNINVTTHTTDSLVFEVGESISITADQTTFAPGAGNRSDDTFARATLKANSSTNSATANYYVYLNIDTNEFKYTTDTKTAELILTVNYKDNDGNITPVTSINGLNYVTVGDISGLDITETNNLITIANNHEITSTGTEVDEWDITLTLVNLDANQTANAGKTFNATLLIQKEELFAGHIISLYTTDGENNLIYHDGNGTYLNAEMEAKDFSYRYAGGDYTIAPAYQDTYKRITKVATSDTYSLLGFICGTNEALPSSACTQDKQYFYLTYEETEIKTQYATYKEALSKLIEDGYLLDTSIKNYVCFGDDCSNSENLYRIIGVFNGKLKLIKADYASVDLIGNNDEKDPTDIIPNALYKGKSNNISKYYWNKTNSNLATNETGSSAVWSYSELNKTNLNTNFLNNIGNKWSNLIHENVWYVGGTAKGSAEDKKIVYDAEVGVDKLITVPYEPYKAKIGLMYVSDYLYSANSLFWNIKGYLANKPLESYAIVRDNNWMFLGGAAEWTITRIGATRNTNVNFITSNGSKSDTRVGNATTASYAVRPTFYLKSSVTFAGGTGTETDPYRIA